MQDKMPGSQLGLLMVLLALTLCLVCPAYAAESPAASIKVVMNNNYPPFSFLDDAGKLQGILVDEWRLWEQKTGRKAELHAMDWNQAQRRMDAGEFDVIEAIFFNESRAKKYDFSKPYYTIEAPAFFNSNITGINSADSLRGFVVAVMSGDSVIDVLKRHGVTHLLEFDSYQSIINAAQQGKVVVFVADKPAALYYLYKTGLYQKFKQSPPIDKGELYRAVRKGNKAMLAGIERGFAGISKSELSAIEAKWYGSAPYTVQPPKYLLPAAAGAAGLVLLLCVWNFTLRRLVAARTVDLTREIEVSRQTAEELRRSEERFEAIFNSVSEAIFINAPETGDILDVNQRVYEMFGYSREEARGIHIETISSGVSPFTQQEAIQYLRKAAQGTPQLFEWQGRERNGRVFWIEMTVRKARLGDKDRLLVTVRDISGRKQGEEALRKSEEKYRDIFEYSPIAIFQSTQAGGFLSVNPALVAMFGYDSPAQMMASISDIPNQIFVQPEQRSELIREVLASGSFVRREVDYRRRDGSEFIANLYMRVVRDDSGAVQFLEGFVEDITERKRAEERNLRLAAIVDSSDDAIIGKTLEGAITSWNKGAERIFGYTEAEMIGNPITLLIPSEHRDEVSLVRDKIRNGEHIEHFEAVRIRKDGEHIYMSLTFSPVMDGQGRIVGVSSIGRDITELKKVQRMLLENARINRELEIAEEIQESFLPACPPQLPGLLMACCCQPAAHVGGDYYDFFTPEAGMVDLVIADITGHNIGAALLMTETHSVLHAKVRGSRSPGKLLAAVNDLLYDDLCRAELQISMFYARFDRENSMLTFANAGHNRPLLYRSRDGVLEELDADGLLLGIMRGVRFEEKSVGVDTGDILLMYTDGVTEAENVQGEPFGAGRLGRIVTAQCQGHPQQMIDTILAELATFSEAISRADDVTMVAIKII
jgi:phosphoserine phosphatase RsbU/P